MLENCREKRVFELRILYEETSAEPKNFRNYSHGVKPFRSTNQRQRQVVVKANVRDQPEVHERLVSRGENNSLRLGNAQKVLNRLNLSLVDNNLVEDPLPKLVRQVEMHIRGCCVESSS